MPGGRGTSGPWGAAGTSAPSRSYSSPGGGNVTQGSNQQANRINQQKEERRNQVIQAQQNERDWAAEFADVPSNVTYPKPADPYDWTKANYGGVSPEYQDYLDRLTRHTKDGFSWYEEKGKTWEQRRDEQLISAFGGILKPGDQGYWDPLQGLSDADRTALHDQGEFPWPPPGGSVTGGDGQNDQGGYWDGSGGSQGDPGYGYGYSGDDDPLARGYQRAKFAPGTLLEQVNQNYMRLAGLQKKRGGIISLLELR
tara:strand:- start:78 stop:839 length:762 start_codon:yes stop_codon:yes gene_type:complete